MIFEDDYLLFLFLPPKSPSRASLVHVLQECTNGFGPGDPKVATAMQGYAYVLRKMQFKNEAFALETTALKILANYRAESETFHVNARALKLLEDLKRKWPRRFH